MQPLQHSFTIEQTWDGQAASPEERTRITLGKSDGYLNVSLQTKHWRDPAPALPPGSTPKLWEHEVVEVFLLGSQERYLELEFGPYGHYLVLQLQGRRNLVEQGMQLTYQAEIVGDQWQAKVSVPAHLLPEGLCQFNAYAIHGQGPARRYLALYPPMGAQPDFHALDSFAPLPARLLELF